MKLNLGCGYDRREGWLNVDRAAHCRPDKLLDIEATPWDLPSDGFEHVLMKHVLEHVGADFGVFGAILRELYRVTAPGGLVEIHVPHVRHDSFWADPTHVRAFTPETFQMLSKRQNREWVATRANYTMLALELDVDFEIETVAQFYEADWRERIRSGELTVGQVQEMARHRWNIAYELQARLRVVK
jgi:predicted SAM-dependent methyltransferase